MKNTKTTPANPLVQKYASARSNLMLMLALTALNIVLLIVEADYMLLFSATIPYVASIYAMIYGMVPGGESYMYAAISVAAVCLVLYLICWLLSKKNVTWMIVAFVLFILDTVYMAYFYISASDASGILDVLIHALVLYYLFVGVKSGLELKKQPEEVVEVSATVAERDSAYTNNTDIQ